MQKVCKNNKILEKKNYRILCVCASKKLCRLIKCLQWKKICELMFVQLLRRIRTKTDKNEKKSIFLIMALLKNWGPMPIFDDKIHAIWDWFIHETDTPGKICKGGKYTVHCEYEWEKLWSIWKSLIFHRNRKKKKY